MLNSLVPTAAVLCQKKTKLRQGHGIRILSKEAQSERGKIAVRTPSTPVLEEFVRAVFDDMP
jgi:hypothetical protein